MRIGVVSLFPLMIRDALAHGVLGRALERGVVEVDYFDPRDYTSDSHRTVDDRPYGGGPGMVLKMEPLQAALRAAKAALPAGSLRVYLGADGRRFDQDRAREARDWPGLILVAGRYEGVDERFIECEIDEQWSIGDYVLTGGELPAVLASGDHAAIQRWRLQQALGRTWLRRPELLERRGMSGEERALLEEFKRAVNPQ